MSDLHLGVRARVATTGEELVGLRALATRLAGGLGDGLYLVAPSDVRALDPLVVLGALAPLSGPLTLGELPSRLHRRQPGLLAKVVATLDVVSGGRAVAVLGRADDAAPSSWSLEAALEGLRAMLRVPEVLLRAPGVTLSGARNMPLAASTPVPVGLFLDAAAWSQPGAGESTRALDLIGLAARFCELLYVEIDKEIDLVAVREAISPSLARAGRLSGDLVVHAVLPAAFAETSRVRGVVESLIADGVVFDLGDAPHEDQLAGVLAVLRELRGEARS